ncbi:MAG: D-isomer specific 2-hydroxyacid dehydrogenase family protein [Micrococcales bacterium]
MKNNLIALEPNQSAAYVEAVTQAGGQVVPMSPEVRALVWTDYSKPQALAQTIQENPQLEWVQLPFAGVDAFNNVLQLPIRFTSAKGAYREPVAEHALMLCMALGRKLPERVRAQSWGQKFAVSLYDANVTIIGAGGITEELLRLLAPFRSRVTVVRNSADPMPGAHETMQLEKLDSALSTAHFVILACALTPATLHLMNLDRLKKMRPEAYLINVARGPHVVSSDLIEALENGIIAGAGIDVTDPEPLPDGHPLWQAPNLIITPHTADTNVQVERLFSERLRVNVAAFLGGGQWLGIVDPKLGY